MKPAHLLASLTAALLLCATAPLANCADNTNKPKPWETLTDCEYVAAKYNDADSFRVRSGDKEFVVRLYYVDAPESTMNYPERVRQQSEHYGITMDETLKAGARAAERVHELLKTPFVVRTRWANAAGRGGDGRYYGFIEVGGKSLAEILVSEGLAQTKGISPNLPDGRKASAYKLALLELEQFARQKHLGAWATTQETKSEKTEKNET
ncbi:hypothetical protein Ga0100231_020225 [Opitutaceae bacterium TAV4]|nr:hypothetical protein Ga0100231_020225 [Opitutaceae bacterium TAV4]RRK00382.1 hypothetical protein Ga0100230_021020 [Opitutaceae bacterium TAV3]